MTIGRDLIVEAFPKQPRMQAAFEALVSDAEDTVESLKAAAEALAGLSGDSATIFDLLAKKQPKNDTLSAVALIPSDPGVLEQIQPGIVSIRAIDTADTASLLTRALADSRYLGGNHPAAGALVATNNLSDLTSKVTARANLTTSLGNYVNDAAAATGGVSVGQWYRNGSALMIRVA